MVIDADRPLEAVAGERVRVVADAGDREVTGNGPDRGADRRGAGAAGVEDLARGPEAAVGRHDGRERLDDVGRDAVGPRLLHELDELRRQHRCRLAESHARAQHVARKEEEGVVLLDRAPESPGVLRALEIGDRALEDVLLLEGVVGEVGAEAAVPVVGAALGDDVDEGAGVAAVLRGEVVDRDAHFLDVLGVGVDVGDAVALAGRDRLRVHQEAVGLGARSVGVHVDAELVVVDVAGGLGVGVAAAGGQAGHAGREDDQVEEVAPDERDVLDLVLLDEAGHARLRGLDEGRLCDDRHLLGAGGAQLERDVDGLGLRGLEPDVLQHPRLEAGERHLQAVGRRRQRGEPEVPGARGLDRLRDAGVFVGGGDRRCRHQGALGVGDGPLNGTRELRPGLRAAEGHRHQQPQRERKSPASRHSFASSDCLQVPRSAVRTAGRREPPFICLL